MSRSIRNTAIEFVQEISPVWAGVAIGALAVAAFSLTPQAAETKKVADFESALKKQGLAGFRLASPNSAQNLVVAGSEKDGTYVRYAMDLVSPKGPVACVTRTLPFVEAPKCKAAVSYKELPALDRERMGKIMNALRSSSALVANKKG